MRRSRSLIAVSAVRGETMLERLAARLDELEQANTRLNEEVAALRAQRRPAVGQPTVRVHMAQPQGSEEPHGRPSRRGMLRAVLGVAAATVGAGALVETQTGTALAQPNLVGISPDSNTPAVTATSNTGARAVDGQSTNGGSGVYGKSDSGVGVRGESTSEKGVFAISASHAGVWGQSTDGGGVVGISSTGSGGVGNFIGKGVFGRSDSGVGVSGYTLTGTGVRGDASSGEGVIGNSDSGDGVSGSSSSGDGVFGGSSSGNGVFGQSDSGIGVHAVGKGASAVALQVDGLLRMNGPVGTATLPAGTTSIPVSTAAATTSSTILLTPLGDPGGQLWIGARAAGSFTINRATENASEERPTNVQVQYLIIN